MLERAEQHMALQFSNDKCSRWVLCSSEFKYIIALGSIQQHCMDNIECYSAKYCLHVAFILLLPLLLSLSPLLFLLLIPLPLPLLLLLVPTYLLPTPLPLLYYNIIYLYQKVLLAII